MRKLIRSILNAGNNNRGKSVNLHREDSSLANVPHHLSLLASGVTPAREAEAGGMTEVPQA